MKAWIWLRGLTGVMAFFTIGHTMGVFSPPTAGAAAAALETMRRTRFPVMGFERTYWEFYRGFGLFVSIEFGLVAVMAYQLSLMSRRNPGEAAPLVFTLHIACVASAILSWMFFFTAPIVTSLAAVVCSTAALLAVKRDARVQRI